MKMNNDPYKEGEYENPFLKGMKNLPADGAEYLRGFGLDDDKAGIILWCMLRIMAGLLAIVWEMRATRAAMEDETQHLAMIALGIRKEKE